MRAVIFDFDGVIVDSERYWIDLDESFFPAVAPGYTQTHAREMMGLGRKAGYEYLVRTLELSLPYDEYVALLMDRVRVIYAEKAQLLPGVVALVTSLRDRESPLGIASSSRRPWIDLALSRLGLAEMFDAISTAEDVAERTKPLPDLYLHAAGQLGIDPADCLAIEDSRNGITAAKAAGMYCIGLRTDMSKEQDLSAADRIVPSLTELSAEELLSL